jgi:hypothetical protein
MDPVRELKIRAEILHKGIAAGDARAIGRLRALPEHARTPPEELTARAREVQRKHCLAVMARECGFADWAHARRVLEGDLVEPDLGTLLYGREPGSSGTLHSWFSSYEDAFAAFDGVRTGGGRPYLLGYKRHFFLADPLFIESLGLAPEDPDWQAIAWNWVRPADRAARARLFHKRLASGIR